MALRQSGGIGPHLARVAASRTFSEPSLRVLAALQVADPVVRRLSPVPIPPRDSMYHAVPSALLYLVNSYEYLGYLRRFAGLVPSSRILDIGCGPGMKGGAIIASLQQGGRYDGFDVRPDAVDWCRRHLATARATFQTVDVANQYYAAEGALSAAELTFPFTAESFDIALAASVFTHLLPAATDNYMAETYRTLTPGGRFVASFLIINEESRRLVDAGRSHRKFGAQQGPVWLEYPDCPEHVIAYEQSYVEAQARSAGFQVGAFLPGSWCGRSWSKYVAYQDLYVLRKPE